ncbi:terminase TerL endonuclease subunit [Ohtaekwangia koreensis]|uniref:Phage terminase-like protein, large subunit, contains N-terminal HTH domain n=1 Tax=Ohtaekwangia koreensis TaxID=688867 RepID=A0A1T5JQ84_9BACT|nr:terminase TerL endonuclease subunit [Ohtaekwangia koreensis]SKC53556.1 Phage terminase-like protein, large subunit, contains N-terminal HTH domain [Ohtaekwangia koreensis]
MADEYINNHIQKLQYYIDSVTGGTAITGHFERKAVERFNRFKYKYDYRENELKRILKFFSLINIPFKNETKQIQLAPWQVFLIASCYCLYYKDTDERVTKEAVISSAGKQGKSTLIVTLALLEVLADQELNATVAIISPTTKQSKLILDYSKQIIESSPAITKLFNITHSTVYNKQPKSTNSILVLTNETEKIQGTNLSASILDEIFLYNDLDIRYVAKRKSGARKNPIQYSIGTVSSKDTKGFSDLYQPCIKILDGDVEDDEMFIYIFQQDDEKELSQPELWRKSNPSIELMGNIEDLKKEYNKTKVYPSNLATFKTETLNYWKEVGLECPFIDNEVLNNSIRDNHLVPLGSKCWIGVDLSSNVDLTSIALLAEVDDKFYCKTINIMPNAERNFIKGNEIDLSRLFVTDLQDFIMYDYNYSASTECVIRCQTPVLDELLVEEILIDLSNKYKVQGIYYDRYNSKQIMHRLSNKGLNVIPIAQNIGTLSQPLKYLERKIISGEYFIEKNLCTKWQAGNINLYTSFKNDIQLQKNKKGHSIDAWIAQNIAMAGYWLDNFDKMNALLDNW